MINPWESMDLSIYESHMSAGDVFQLQTLCTITKQQINAYDHTYVTILGIAGGNGLEHIDVSKTKKVYGLDVNMQYLTECKERYPGLTGILELTCCDLSIPKTVLPCSNILICNLIIEYLGEERFVELIKNNKNNLNIVSCVIQKNNDNTFVSHSNVKSAFDNINAIHQDICPNKLSVLFEKIGFCLLQSMAYPLPNGKEFIRMDFSPCHNKNLTGI